MLAGNVTKLGKEIHKKNVHTGEVVAKKTGRPLDLVGMHPREEHVMMEAMLEHPEKTLAEIIVREMMTVFGNRSQVSTVCRYFQRNGVKTKRVSSYRQDFHRPFYAGISC